VLFPLHPNLLKEQHYLLHPVIYLPEICLSFVRRNHFVDPYPLPSSQFNGEQKPVVKQEAKPNIGVKPDPEGSSNTKREANASGPSEPPAARFIKIELPDVKPDINGPIKQEPQTGRPPTNFPPVQVNARGQDAMDVKPALPIPTETHPSSSVSNPSVNSAQNIRVKAG
jgi:hypothetical protein